MLPSYFMLQTQRPQGATRIPRTHSTEPLGVHAEAEAEAEARAGGDAALGFAALAVLMIVLVACMPQPEPHHALYALLQDIRAADAQARQSHRLHVQGEAALRAGQPDQASALWAQAQARSQAADDAIVPALGAVQVIPTAELGLLDDNVSYLRANALTARVWRTVVDLHGRMAERLPTRLTAAERWALYAGVRQAMCFELNTYDEQRRHPTAAEWAAFFGGPVAPRGEMGQALEASVAEIVAFTDVLYHDASLGERMFGTVVFAACVPVDDGA